MSARRVWFWDTSVWRKFPGLITPAFHPLCGRKVDMASFSSWPCASQEERKGIDAQRALSLCKRQGTFGGHLYLLFAAAHGQRLPTQHQEAWLCLGFPPGTRVREHSTFHVAKSIKLCTQSLILQNEIVNFIIQITTKSFRYLQRHFLISCCIIICVLYFKWQCNRERLLPYMILLVNKIYNLFSC